MRDINEARRFIHALTGSPFSNVTFQAFYDPKNLAKPEGVYPETWTSTLDASEEFIQYKQSQYCGVYVTVNGTDGTGRETSNITDLRAFFVDFDGMTEPTWAITPHIIQRRDDTHGHAFWLIDGSDLENEEWTIIQKRLSLFYGSDPQVIDPARVVRLPGSWHMKDPWNPTFYTITTDNTGNGHKYSVNDIVDAHLLSPEKDMLLNEWAEAREKNMSGSGYDNDPHELKLFTGFITNAAHPAILGSGTLELFRVSCYGHDHGIDYQHAVDLLWEHYNPRCIPPWGDHERDHFESVVYRAYKYPSSVAGCKTLKHQFNTLPPLQEPQCGWENMSKVFHDPVKIDLNDTYLVDDVLPSLDDSIDRGLRASHAKAVILSAQLTGKSSHYDFAEAFDGLRYDGVNLIRNQKQYYRFQGKSWKTVDDDVIKAEIHRTFRGYKPSDSMTAGIFRVLHDRTNVENVENGTWLNNTKLNTSNFVVFQNGIVDLNSKDLTMIPHTPAFFVLNELSYDFEPTAQCPRWLSFLDSIWGNNETLKMQLQEFMGYCLTADNSLQKFALLIGKSRAGKGVITDIMREMVGEENTCAPTLSNIVKDSMLSEMSTKSLGLIPEAHNLAAGVKDSVLTMLKAVIGGDTISYHEMYKGGRNSKFTLKLVMSTNNLPQWNDASGALMNRALVFKFDKSFVGREDTDLRSKLLTEIAGITQWAIKGLRRLRQNQGRFTEAECGINLKEEIKKDMFPLSGFVDECLIIDADGFAGLEEMYKSYRIWAASDGIKTPMNKSSFNQTLRNSSMMITSEEGGYRGISLKPLFPPSNVVPMVK